MNVTPIPALEWSGSVLELHTHDVPAETALARMKAADAPQSLANTYLLQALESLRGTRREGVRIVIDKVSDGGEVSFSPSVLGLDDLPIAVMAYAISLLHALAQNRPAAEVAGLAIGLEQWHTAWQLSAKEGIAHMADNAARRRKKWRVTREDRNVTVQAARESRDTKYVVVAKELGWSGENKLPRGLSAKICKRLLIDPSPSNQRAARRAIQRQT